MSEVLMEVKDVTKHFPVKGNGLIRKTVAHVKAVDGVSFQIKRGETFGLVGESGCGKSTLGQVLIRLQDPTEGEILFQGQDIADTPLNKLRPMRRDLQIVFQDPYASLNPKMTIGETIGEPLLVHKVGNRSDIVSEVKKILPIVGLHEDFYDRYPHELSGGQRQRVGIARALIMKPKLIICDEPVSALDVSIQSQIINLFMDLQEQFDLTYLFIAHGLAVVKHISSRIGVMYLGKIVEIADKQELFNNPQHPYTKALLSAIPASDPFVSKQRKVLEGDVPNPTNPPSGCRFHTRCPHCSDRCRQEEPQLFGGEDHQVACFLKSLP
ncbi:MAG: ABC transporter ATP-binding protein [Spirochaetota bacterium]